MVLFPFVLEIVAWLAPQHLSELLHFVVRWPDVPPSGIDGFPLSLRHTT